MTTPFKFIRMAAGVTQADISRALDVDISLISRIEGGQLRQTPKVVQTQVRIAEFLGLPVETLFPER